VIITVVHTSTKMRTFFFVLLFVAFAAVSAQHEVDIKWNDFDSPGSRPEIYQKALQTANKAIQSTLQSHVDAINKSLGKELDEVDKYRFITSLEDLTVSRRYAITAEDIETYGELLKEKYETLGKMHPKVYDFVHYVREHLATKHAYQKNKDKNPNHMHHNLHPQMVHGVHELQEGIKHWTAETTYAEALYDLYNIHQKLGEKIPPTILVLMNTLEEALENGAEMHDKLSTENLQIPLVEYKFDNKPHFTHSNHGKKSFFGENQNTFLKSALENLLGFEKEPSRL